MKLHISELSLKYLPGPTAKTVNEPAAICVRPASAITLASNPNSLASLCNCNLVINKIFV